ncbi:MAG: hypothetical protein H6Q92_1884, partial [Nitrospirae bacterium]|nr:hypothetical protein [Nitrospirota bacterium]
MHNARIVGDINGHYVLPEREFLEPNPNLQH